MQRRGIGSSPEEASEKVSKRTGAVAGAAVNRARHERGARVMVASAAQQGVAPEPPKRHSYGYW
jgi:hypothetical protein